MDKPALNTESAETIARPAKPAGEASGNAEAVQQDAESAPKTLVAASRGARLAKLPRTHALVFLVALSLFAAADSWSAISGLGIAGLLCVITGALAGITIPTLVHEWFHLLGAPLSSLPCCC